ncbi:MAG: sigma-54 dependent transcriptional regulator, partial [Polyangiaceae bacterium]
KSRRVLVVDDEQGLRDMLAILFRREGFDVTVAHGLKSGSEAVAKAVEPFELVFTDLLMPDGSGLDMVTAARNRSAKTEVIVVTAHSTIETAVDAMRRGAYDFITKPFSTSVVRALAHKALEKRTLILENEQLRAQIGITRGRDLLGKSEAMRRIVDLIGRIAKSKSTVLITGESGTGKERISRAIHQMSERASGPFLVVSCGAIPEQLMESELFGHEKGAFTGADKRRNGIFQEANGGTVLLDEVGELPLPLQVKLLRVLQERTVRMVGGSAEMPVDVRILAATNRHVEDDVKSGKFRQDLYYRLNVIRIEVPPLRARKEDVRELAERFLKDQAASLGKEMTGFASDALRALDAYSFPGNVRELENVVERAVALSMSPIIGLGDLPEEISGAAGKPTPSLSALPALGVDLDSVLGEMERRLILQALEMSDGVRTNAAKLLRVTLRSLRYRMQKLEMAPADEADNDPPSGTPPSSS